MRVQSSATGVGAPHHHLARCRYFSTAWVRRSPGMRKNGASVPSPPSAALIERTPLSTSLLGPRLADARRSGSDGSGCGCRWCDPIRRASRTHLRISCGHAADHEERRLDAFVRQRRQHAVGVGRQRAVIEGEHHLAVAQRQRLPVLHLAEAGIVVRADGHDPADAERIGIAGAGLGGLRCRRPGHRYRDTRQKRSKHSLRCEPLGSPQPIDQRREYGESRKIAGVTARVMHRRNYRRRRFRRRLWFDRHSRAPMIRPTIQEPTWTKTNSTCRCANSSRWSA